MAKPRRGPVKVRTIETPGGRYARIHIVNGPTGRVIYGEPRN